MAHNSKRTNYIVLKCSDLDWWWVTENTESETMDKERLVESRSNGHQWHHHGETTSRWEEAHLKEIFAESIRAETEQID